MENIEKKMKELCITTKNTKESQIEDELELVSMNETINFISEKFDEFEKDRRKKDKILKKLSKKTSEIFQMIEKIENLADRKEQNSRRNCFLVDGIAETNDENTDGLVLKTINKKLQVNIAENKIDRSHRIGRKKDGQRPRPIIIKLTRYNTSKKVIALRES